MCLSRVRKSEDLCIVQAFSPNLFTNGELIGPHTFLQVHRKEISLQQAKAQFEKDAPKKKRHPDIMLFCRGCSPQPGKPEKLLPLREFVTAWDHNHWFQVLSQGMCRLCTQCREKQQPSAQATTAAEADVCAYCLVEPANHTGYCSECLKGEKLACAKCDIGKKIKTKRLTDFDPAEVKRRKKTKEMRRVRCKKCAVPSVTSISKQGLCVQCNKAVSVSHLTQYNAETQTGLCRQCKTKNQRAPKTCAKCAQPLLPTATPGTWCRACAYPPCALGCGRPRPEKGACHAKTVAYWVCPKCPDKLCTNCRGQLPATAPKNTLCAQCTWPPCTGCGQPRPREANYRVKLMETWQCATCCTKVCSKCGASLDHKAPANSWCARCTYPPCTGCGRARPQKTRYHVKVLPTWKCVTCSKKVCSQCGAEVAGNAVQNSWCTKCAYPPCKHLRSAAAAPTKISRAGTPCVDLCAMRVQCPA